MGWFSALFSLENGRRAGKRQIFSSTNDAFSLPTSSPSIPPHPDAFSPETSTLATFTYPPHGGYLPPPSRQGSLLPTHMDAIHTRSPYPPLSKTWARIRNWLNREYPELGDTLGYGLPPQDLSEIEMQFGFALPAVVRESYLCVDGQEAESAAGCSEGLFFGLKFLPLESVLEEWKFWREVDQDPTTGANTALVDSMQSIPPDWVKKAYSESGWIPLIADKVGNYIGVDLHPAENGQVGQVIVFGRDFDTKVVLWTGDGLTGWAKWLANFAEELESGDSFEIGNNSDSDSSEDSLGYDGYFYDGKGRGEGAGGVGSGGGLRLTGEYKGWNVLEAWADRSLRKWHRAGVITDADLAPLEGSPTKQAPGDLDIVDSNGSATEIHIPVVGHDEVAVAPSSGLRSHNSQRSQSTIRTQRRDSKPPAPLPVALPTPHDIAPLHSPTDSDDDLEAGRSHHTDLSLTREDETENLGLVSSTKRRRSPKRWDPTTDSMLPHTPRSSSDSVTSNPVSSNLQSMTSQTTAVLVPLQYEPTQNVPDLLMDTTPSTLDSAPPLQPSTSGLKNESDSMRLESSPVSNSKEGGILAPDPEPTVRLIGGAGVDAGPVEVGAEMREVHSDPPLTVHHEMKPETEPTLSIQVASPLKEHKKSKPSLTNFKRFSVGALGRRKD